MRTESIIRELRAKADRGDTRLTHKWVDATEMRMNSPSPNAPRVPVEEEAPEPKRNIPWNNIAVWVAIAAVVGYIAWPTLLALV